MGESGLLEISSARARLNNCKMNLRFNPVRQGLFKQGLSWLVVLSCCLCLSTGAKAQSWRSVGPGGGDVRALAVDPGHAEFVYLGTTDGHIFGSRDSGEHWNLLGMAGSGSNAIVTAIIVDPRNSGVLFASTWTRESHGEGGGVFLSLDGGRSWHESGLAGHAVRALVQSSSDPDILTAGALDGIFRSRDRGATWERISPAEDDELKNIDSLLVDLHDPDVIFAGTFHLPWKTTDGGRQWLPIHDGMIDDSDVLSLALDPADPQHIFASACSGIYRSDDAGSLWQKMQGVPYSSRRTLVIRVDPANSANLYAGTTEGLWKSADRGANWRRISPGDWVVNSLMVEPEQDPSDPADRQVRPGRILVGTEEQGVLASDDGGENFHEANDGFFHRRVVSLAMNSEKPGKIVAVISGGPNPVLASEDGGSTWSPLVAGLDSSEVQHLFSMPDGWWAAYVSGGLARFDSEKRAWTRVGMIVETTSAHPSTVRGQSSRREAPFTAHVNDLSFNGGIWFAATAEGLFASSDAGSHWRAVPFAPIALPVNFVRADDSGRKLRIVTSLAMVFSDDAGATWQWRDLPFESGGVLGLELADDSTILAVARSGLYISRDAGITWRQATGGLPQAPLSNLFVRRDLWLVSIEAGGLYLSRDRGGSWSRVEKQARNQRTVEHGQFQMLLAEPATGIVYAGSVTEGLYVLDLNSALESASVRASGK